MYPQRNQSPLLHQQSKTVGSRLDCGYKEGCKDGLNSTCKSVQFIAEAHLLAPFIIILSVGGERSVACYAEWK